MPSCQKLVFFSAYCNEFRKLVDKNLESQTNLSTLERKGVKNSFFAAKTIEMCPRDVSLRCVPASCLRDFNKVAILLVCDQAN